MVWQFWAWDLKPWFAYQYFKTVTGKPMLTLLIASGTRRCMKDYSIGALYAMCATEKWNWERPKMCSVGISMSLVVLGLITLILSSWVYTVIILHSVSFLDVVFDPEFNSSLMQVMSFFLLSSQSLYDLMLDVNCHFYFLLSILWFLLIS